VSDDHELANSLRRLSRAPVRGPRRGFLLGGLSCRDGLPPTTAELHHVLGLIFGVDATTALV
jgi:hypothetical protein